MVFDNNNSNNNNDNNNNNSNNNYNDKKNNNITPIIIAIINLFNWQVVPGSLNVAHFFCRLNRVNCRVNL